MFKSLIMTLFLLSLISCRKTQYTDMGEITNFDYRNGWPNVTIITLSSGMKISYPGTIFGATGQHLYVTSKPNWEDPFIKIE